MNMRLRLTVASLSVIVVLSCSVAYVKVRSAMARSNTALSQEALIEKGLSEDSKRFVLAHKVDCGANDALIVALVKKSPEIEVVWLTQCPQVTDESLRAIAQLEYLHTLGIQGAPAITASGWVALTQLGKLKELSIAGVAIDVDSAKAICDIASLMRLTVSEANTSSEVLSYIQRRRPEVMLRIL